MARRIRRVNVAARRIDDAYASRVEIRVLGPLGLIDEGRQVPVGGRRQRAVLAGLVLADGHPVSTGALVEFVWGDDPPPTARKSLQTYVSRLRRLLGEDAIRASSDGYRLATDVVRIDVDRFEDLAERGRRLLPSDPAAAFESFEAALSLWRGSPLSDVDAYGELTAHIERLAEARLSAIEDRIEAGLALGRHAELVGDLQSLVGPHPLRERLWGQLMLALYRSGRQAEALRAFQRCRQVLTEELGIEPSLSLRELEERILDQDPGLDVASAPPPAMEERPQRNPYKGLRAFSESDAGDFFGREELVASLARRIEAGDRFLALIGPSGSGKSSVALAGLIPRFRGGTGWTVTRMTPGTHPFTQLESALMRAVGRADVHIRADDRLALLRAVLTLLPDDDTELLLIIDQFEELLTGAMPEDQVIAFAEQLAEAVEDPHGRLRVVITLRADFFDQALRRPELAELLSTGGVNVPPLSAVELQAAITRPAQAVGLDVEPELVAELVAETAHHPGSLPLLQFVLTDLTERAPGRVLTLTALRDAGGIRGTLAQRAEEVYATLSPSEGEAARRLFLRLVALNQDGEPTRRVVPVDDLRLSDVEPGATQRVVDALVEARLLTFGREAPGGQPTVEVAHEAVFREWPRCTRWVEEARSDIRLAAGLERAAADWAGAERSPDYLATGSKLRAFEELAERSSLGVSPAAAWFMEASIHRRRDEEERESARAERERLLERRSVNRLRLSAGILALLALITTVLFVFANRQREAALSAATEILVRQLSNAAFAQVGRDPQLSLLLALHAVNVASTRDEPVPVETIEALHWGLQESRVQYPVADGDILLLVGPGGPRGAYHLPIDELVHLARSNVTRQLTEDECARFLSSGGCPRLPAEPGDGELEAEEMTIGGLELLSGTSVRMATVLTDTDLAAYRAEFESFGEATGIRFALVEDSGLEGAIAIGERHGNIDVIDTPQPSWVASETTAGRLVNLGVYLDRARIRSDFGDYLINAGSPDPGRSEGHYSLPLYAGVKGLIWYSPERFRSAGYRAPTTWDELIGLSDRIVEDGGTPWCFAEESGLATGWPATDWVEDILLREHGVEVYDSWVRGEIPFRDPRVRSAFERLGQLIFTEGYVHGGVNTALTTHFGAGVLPLLDDPPGCWMHHQASFVANYLPPGVEPGIDLSAFLTPPIQEGQGDSVLVSGSYALVYTDRPEVREAVRHMASPEYGHVWAERLAGILSSNRRFDVARYPEEWRRTIGKTFSTAQEENRIRFDGSDLMPPEVGTYPFWSAMVEYYRGGPDALDGILARLDQLRADLGG